MNRVTLKKIGLYAGLLLLSTLLMQFVWHINQREDGFSPEKVNLALRRTAHLLLVAGGDSTSLIPPVERTGPGVWLIRLERPFDYDRLPALLQESFNLHDIRQNYDVAVLRCTDGMLQLGYNNLDFLKDNSVPCMGREMGPDCYNLQVSFPALAEKRSGLLPMGWIFILGGVLAVVFFGLGPKRSAVTVLPDPSQETISTANNWLHFANSRLDVANQILLCGQVRHQLTYREAKLLHLFASHPNQLLERGFILQNVWADEGILVGRSVDVFVSRLRKMLRDDSSVSLTTAHGVGYRLEVG